MARLMLCRVRGAVTEPSPQVQFIPVADAEAVLAAAAGALLAQAGERLPDLAHCLVLLPNLYAAGEFKRTLLNASKSPALILPRISTYAQLAGNGESGGDAGDDIRRTAWLYGALRGRGWFDDGSRWGVCRELGALFDELSAHNIAMPRDLHEFRAQLRAAYQAGTAGGIDFEARLVSDLWFALEGTGAPSPAVHRKLRLAKIAAGARGPLLAVAGEQATPEQDAFFLAWSRRQPVTIIGFDPVLAAVEGVSGFLNRVWPAATGDVSPAPHGAAGSALIGRAQALRRSVANSPLAGRVSLIGTVNVEQEATAAALSIGAWLGEGAASIAVVAEDRLVARRLRALLERDGILVTDEAGWKLSTTSAATVVSRWLDTAGEGFYYRDILDLLKSPFAFFDIEAGARRAQIHRLEQIIRRENIIEGLDALLAAAARHADDGALGRLVGRLRLAHVAHARGTRGQALALPLGAWLSRLDEAIEILGIKKGLAHDAAGTQLLELLRERSAALADDRQACAMHEWRAWLNGELEGATFRDCRIESPVVFTQLSSTRLRRFERVLVLGADFAHLPAGPAAVRFFNQRVREALGLPTQASAGENLRRDLISLFACTGEVRVSWQSYRSGEPNAPSALVDILRTLHVHAYGDALAAAGLEARLRAGAATGPGVATERQSSAPRPNAPELLPERLSASGHASLIACPYQFYARHMLRLNEADEVEEQVEKRDLGSAVHRVLKAFHQRVPVLGAQDDATSLQILDAISDREFAPLLARNPLAAGFRAEWSAMMPPYLAWQRQREAEGWRFGVAETWYEKPLLLSDGGRVLLGGRLDRIDRDGGAKLCLLDYKMRSAKNLKKEFSKPGEDVQLATYALLLEGADDGIDGTLPIEAGYLALERNGVTFVRHPGDLAETVARSALRLDQMLTAIRAGAALPAQGVAGVCNWCEMRGLCRRGYWERE